MFKKISKLWTLPFLSVALAFSFASCSDDPEKPIDPEKPEVPAVGSVTFKLESHYDIIKGEPRVITLGKEGTLESDDVFSLELEGSGVTKTMPVEASDETTVTLGIPASCEDGKYNLYFRRGQSSRNLGSFTFAIIDKTFEPQPGTTVYGTITTEEGPVADVLVSDGVLFARTNAEGQYEMQSAKGNGYVFMIVPSGYEPERDGVFPMNYVQLKTEDSTPELANFKLKKVDQSRYKLLFFGDMHLANRTSDISQFASFTKDVNDYCNANKNMPVYAITLGDMTWDIYWYKNNFSLKTYRETINIALSDIMVYHTIGNHDNDFKAKNNADAKFMFRTTIAPVYYSFNIGDAHFVVLDNIDCSTYDGTESRKYTEQLLANQLQWLAQVLTYVDKSTPVFIMMHAPVFNNTGTGYGMKNAQQLVSAVDSYTVHFMTGHTHKNFNVTPKSKITNGKTVYEHNVSAVCGSWWWSGHLTHGVHLSPDGAPGGFGIWNMNGKDMDWTFKPTGKSTDVQFRAYDLNEVKFSAADVPNLKQDTKAYSDFRKYINAYPGNKNDDILINVWNYDPDWTVTVTDENGNDLNVRQVGAYDPLHIAALSVKRYNNDIQTSPAFTTQSYPHFFKCQAPNPNVDVTITVTDRFGHTWTEKMERPKKFSIEAYK